jgi:hypothetical protein
VLKENYGMQQGCTAYCFSQIPVPNIHPYFRLKILASFQNDKEKLDVKKIFPFKL